MQKASNLKLRFEWRKSLGEQFLPKSFNFILMSKSINGTLPSPKIDQGPLCIWWRCDFKVGFDLRKSFKD